ncbi:MAG: protein-tyrosine-phosphatase [Cyclobacteriaceae bacterium]|nr:protein-tyrosine-phosphatase [Cyclobacteriaceae bacterium]
MPSLQNTTNNLVKRFSVIPHERKQLLQQLSAFVQSRVQNRQVAHLNFICTHNSRRSHLSQLWAQAAAYYYGVPNVQAYSGGTEATAFNPRAVKAMMDAGFNIVKLKDGDNPVYEVSFAEEINPVRAFSKKYDDPFNHNKDFAAIMTCSHADENCPLVAGAAARIALTYDDPKEFDGTPLEQEKYKERVEQIGTEILYAFSLISKQ